MSMIPTCREYPPLANEEDQRDGCKVGWRIYANLSDARRCSRAAEHNAHIKASEGYGFGYCSPGSIIELADGRFQVCVP